MLKRKKKLIILYNFSFLMQLFRLPTSNLNKNDLNSVSSLCRCIVTENDQASLYCIKKGLLITVFHRNRAAGQDDRTKTGTWSQIVEIPENETIKAF